ncbi:hypothetical protein HDV02_006574, partial [Globomyces sp. JEL0801]
MENDIIDHLSNNPFNPHSCSKERNTLYKLRDMQNLQFCAADKNLGLVALNIETYHKMVLKHLE